MQYKVRDIGEEPLALDFPVEADWLAGECPGLEIKPADAGLRFRGSLQKSGNNFLLMGELRGTIETPCARCLEPAHVAIQSSLVVTYVPSPEGAPVVERQDWDEEALDEPDVVSFDGEVIDLSGEVRDEVVLSVPINAHCKEDCIGLCQDCGQNRNLVRCVCEERRRLESGKLSALKDIKL